MDQERQPQTTAHYAVSDREVDNLIPDVPPSFPAIDSMSLEELQRLMNDDEMLGEFVKGTPEVKRLNEMKDEVEGINAKLATENLRRENDVERVCAEVEGLKEEASTKLERYCELEKERNVLSRPPDRSDVINLLSRAKKEACRESEKVAEKWLELGANGWGASVTS